MMLLTALVAACGLDVVPAAAQGGPTPLAYQVVEGRNINAFVRDGVVAAHVLLRSGRDPRFLVAFPAGNSGVALWFAPLAKESQWSMVASPVAVHGADSQGRPLHGVMVEAAITAPTLAIRSAALSSVRVLREVELGRSLPAGVDCAPSVSGNTIRWSRDRLDGAPGFALAVEVTHGRLDGTRILAGSEGKIIMRFTALTGEPPLTPLATSALFSRPLGNDPRARQTLEFLSYREKFLAGSWRFNTYFGRDTLMSVRLMMSALAPAAVEAGLSSVLARLSANGEVAHEEDVGEFAILDHLHRDGTRNPAPVYAYSMVDETPMLAPVAAHWLLDDPRGRGRAAAWLSEPVDTSVGNTVLNGAALVRNLVAVAKEAQAFSADPRASNLIALKPGMKAGNWRDSDDGLGGGKYPYDVNAILVPAALEAAARLKSSGLLDSYLDAAGRRTLDDASRSAHVWRTKAPPLFDVRIRSIDARRAVEALSGQTGIAAGPALASLPRKALRFHAIALDQDEHPIPVMSSDEGLGLLLSRPEAGDLDATVALMLRPFPAGLMSGAGLLVANPAFAPPATARRFSRNAYHGMVIWSWQQALLAAGLSRQLQRSDLPAPTRRLLLAAKARLARTIEATMAMRNSELWTWTVRDGEMRASAFGADMRDADESNAAQLWSTVFLGVDWRGRSKH